MRRSLTLRKILAACSLGVVAVVAVACGSDAGSSGEVPQIVATTNILGDIVSQVVGDLAEVEVIMPLGSNPHDFAPSAKQAEAMENADLLVINGAGFEEGMLDVIDAVGDSGTEVFAFADQVDVVDSDPHIWTDPTRMIAAVEALVTELVDVGGLDADALIPRGDAYVAELTALDGEMDDRLSSIPDDKRVLVTNHEVFSYFADRFGFDVVGAVIPSLSTNAESSAAEIEELAALIEREGIPAIFGETTQSTQLADALAAAVGSDVEVVVLFAESLGEPGSGAETYVDMMRANAVLISDALTP
jgi:zinc/manganese transport system substrate-binding protein